MEFLLQNTKISCKILLNTKFGDTYEIESP